MSFFAKIFKRKKPRPIKLGLALGSGGAKGFAELGVLSAFEENGVDFDIVAGTSIGSVIGAFYADGYTVTDISELLKRINFGELMNMFMLKMDTSALMRVLDREIGSLTFEELKKPFAAVATVYDSGEERVFDKGPVAPAICASSSFQPFFKPVVIDGIKYVDGAYANSVPADVVKNMGADYIVGVDLSAHEKSKPSLLTKLIPAYEGKVEEPWKAGYENSDVMIHPDLSDFKSTALSSANIMYDIGYRAALKVMPKIKEDIENLKNPKKKTKKQKRK